MVETETLQLHIPRDDDGSRELVYEGPPPPEWLEHNMNPNLVIDWFMLAPDSQFPDGFEEGTMISYEGWSWILVAQHWIQLSRQ